MQIKMKLAEVGVTMIEDTEYRSLRFNPTDGGKSWLLLVDVPEEIWSRYQKDQEYTWEEVNGPTS